VENASIRFCSCGLASLGGQVKCAGRPNGLEMSRPASQDQYRAKAKDQAGRVGSIELVWRHRAVLGGGASCFGRHFPWRRGRLFEQQRVLGTLA